MDYEFDFIVIAGRSSYHSSVPMKSEPSGGLIANMVATVAHGFIWSTGNAMAHRAIYAIMGPRTVQIENCINTSGSDIIKCQFYMDMLSQCRKSGSATPVAVSF
ncbi:coiled-coil-helix-coiled-coil-helix domain-containing protein 10, mitochondrial [Artemisia annua]|uniref:Coiled-coil-helix-coiled-coil-helix domain-containing protein 10, mitochondrial n=1 Tax=Artemisia annua TaxID=35608 RepID=A0A2U1QB78_ARTAN|nr:coiled-coil-helix-coiled-coil-helix domain-containing protein 10, mitochondrial [Artemisia annua]